MSKLNIIIFCGLLCAATTNAQAQSGTTGSLQWSISAGTLTISGAGAMPRYGLTNNGTFYVTTAPWGSHYASITSVIIGEGVNSISINAFVGCSSLKEVTIGNSVTSIKTQAFSYCSSLIDVTIGNSVNSIETGAFGGCSSLIEINIPNSVTSMDGSFNGCSSLTAINVETDNNNYSSINGVLYNKNQTTLIRYPIGKQGGYTIPNSVTSIVDNAFNNCSSLKVVRCLSKNPPNCYAFMDISAATLYVPAGKTSVYQAAGWNNFEIVEFGYGISFVTPTTGVYVNLTNSEQIKVILYNSHSVQLSDFQLTLEHNGNAIGSETFIGSIPIGGQAEYTFTATLDLSEKRVHEINVAISMDEVEFANETISIALPDCTSYLYSGTTGILVWWLCPDGTLIINGEGAMPNYSHTWNVTLAPWGSHYASITSVIIGDGVTSIGSYAFCGLSSLIEVTIPNSVISIGNRAFIDCSSLIELTIGNSVTSIGDEAFEHCISLIELTIPDSVISIGNRAFQSCSSLIEVTIPNSVTSIGVYAFMGCSSLIKINVDTDNNLFSSINGVLFNKNQTTLILYPEGKQGGYTIPNSVTSIGYEAFVHCVSLIEVIIPNSVISIGDFAFRGCSHLTSVTVHWVNPLHIDSNVFIYIATNTIALIVPPGTEEDYTSAEVWKGFYFEEISAPFAGECGDNLTWGYNVASGILNISGTGDMYNYNPSSLPWNSFSQKIRTFVLPDGITSIGDCAFFNCINLNDISIPNSVTSIGNYTFQFCSSLIAINVDTGNNNYSSINGVLFNKNQTTLIQYPGGKQGGYYTIPNSVNSIRDEAFSNCSSLIKVTIPNSVTSIGDEAFYNCSSLNEVTIGNSVTSIGDYAFSYCESLKEVTIGNAVTTIGNVAFYNCSNLTEIGRAHV